MVNAYISTVPLVAIHNENLFINIKDINGDTYILPKFHCNLKLKQVRLPSNTYLFLYENNFYTLLQGPRRVLHSNFLKINNNIRCPI